MHNAGFYRFMNKEHLRKWIVSIITRHLLASFNWSRCKKWQNVWKAKLHLEAIKKDFDCNLYLASIYFTSCPIFCPTDCMITFVLNMSLLLNQHAKAPMKWFTKGLLTWAYWLLLITFKCHLHKQKLLYIKWHHWEILTLLKYFTSLDERHVSHCVPTTFQILISECICIIGKLGVKGDGQIMEEGVFGKWQKAPGHFQTQDLWYEPAWGQPGGLTLSHHWT